MKEGGVCSPQRQLPVAVLEVAAAFMLLAVLSAFAAGMVELPRQAIWAAAGVLLAVCAAILYQWPDPRTTLGPANRVTLGRAVLLSTKPVSIATLAAASTRPHASTASASPSIFRSNQKAQTRANPVG